MTPAGGRTPLAGLTADYATTPFQYQVRVNTLSRVKARYLTALPTFLASAKVPQCTTRGYETILVVISGLPGFNKSEMPSPNFSYWQHPI